MKVLSISTVFPNLCSPGLGLFVRSRLQRVAAAVELKVIAPVPLLDYAQMRAMKTARPAIPGRRQDGRLEVLHPRWLYPPFAGAWNAVFLYVQLLLPAAGLRKRFRFDLIDAHFAFPDGVAAALLAKTLDVPYLVTLRGNETMHAQYPLRRWFIRRALRAGGRVICVSESLRQFAISLGVDPARTKTIPNGIDTAMFYPRDRAAGRRKYEIPDGARMVLTVGALIERKGHHRAVQALSELRQEGIQALLLIAGGSGREGHFAEAIHRTVTEAGMESQVRFLGQVAPYDLPELMSAADVFCLPSTREGWPNVVHEAMACGTPVVATDVGGVPDMIPSDDYGIVVAVNDPAALRNGLRTALMKRWNRESISTRARSRSWEQVGDEVLEQMNAVFAERVKRRASQS